VRIATFLVLVITAVLFKKYQCVWHLFNCYFIEGGFTSKEGHQCAMRFLFLQSCPECWFSGWKWVTCK